MSLDVLALPLLIVTAIGAAGYAWQLRQVGDAPDLRGAWLLLAFIVAATLLALAFMGVNAGFVGFSLYTLLIVGPLWLRQRLHRAITAGDEARARRLGRLFTLLRPTRAVRDEVASLPTILALRAGDEVAPADLDRVTADRPQLRRCFDVIALHNRRDVEPVLAAFQDPCARAELFEQGLGPVYVQALGCVDPDGDALAAAVAAALAGDPNLQQPERFARFIIQVHALAGELATTRKLLVALGMYLERGDASLILALAQWCSGDLAAARETLAAAAPDVHGHRVARSMLASFDAMLQRRGPRPQAHVTPALRHRLDSLRRAVPVLQVLSPFLGRHALRPRLTWAWITVILAVYAAYAASGDPGDPEHAYAWGALYVPEFGPGEAWRLATLTLLHAGGLHLGLNVLMLWRFGGFVEALYGRARLAAIYVLSAAISGLTVALIPNAEQTLLLGASGAIMALGGAVLAALLVRKDLRATRIGRAELIVLALLFGLQILFDAITPQVSGTAHLSGIAAGILLGALLMPRARPLDP